MTKATAESAPNPPYALNAPANARGDSSANRWRYNKARRRSMGPG